MKGDEVEGAPLDAVIVTGALQHPLGARGAGDGKGGLAHGNALAGVIDSYFAAEAQKQMDVVGLVILGGELVGNVGNGPAQKHQIVRQ